MFWLAAALCFAAVACYGWCFWKMVTSRGKDEEERYRQQCLQLSTWYKRGLYLFISGFGILCIAFSAYNSYFK